jgi:hypothetical protein
VRCKELALILSAVVGNEKFGRNIEDDTAVSCRRVVIYSVKLIFLDDDYVAGYQIVDVFLHDEFAISFKKEENFVVIVNVQTELFT